MNPREYCAAAAKALSILGKAGSPQAIDDAGDWYKAVEELRSIIYRNGYEITQNGTIRQKVAK